MKDQSGEFDVQVPQEFGVRNDWRGKSWGVSHKKQSVMWCSVAEHPTATGRCGIWYLSQLSISFCIKIYVVQQITNWKLP